MASLLSIPTPFLRMLAAAAAIGALELLGAPAHAQPDTPPALDAAINSTAPGGVVSIADAYPYTTLNQNPNQLPLVPGTLIYSDDPETASGSGILYRDTAPAGPVRVYIYHVNNNAAAAKITAVIENTGTATANITYVRKSLPAPSGNYVLAGKQGVQLFYENTALPAPKVLAPGAAALLDSALDSTSVSNGQLVNATYEFTSDQPLRVTTLILPIASNTLAVLGAQTVLPGDGNNRQGTFPHFGKSNSTPYTWNTGNGMRLLRIGNANAAYDPNIPGWDAERAVATEMRGGYAVTYQVRVNVSRTDGRRMALLLNPRGGAYSGYIRTTMPESGTAVGQLLPSPALNMGDSTKAIVCAVIPLTATPQTLLIEFIPAGAASLPFELILTPISQAANVPDWTLY